jgi:mannose-6-phosphate isomerase-like protein (cupin superfamily)
MKPFLFSVLLAGAVIGFAGPIAAAEPPLTAVLQLDRAQIDHTMGTGGALLGNSLYKIQIGRRVVPGPFVEIHTHDTDIFHILEGSATFVTGGTAVDPQPASPGEIHAKSIVGGTEHHLTKGDIIVIPHGIPHRFTKIEHGPLVYFVVKVVQ